MTKGSLGSFFKYGMKWLIDREIIIVLACHWLNRYQPAVPMAFLIEVNVELFNTRTTMVQNETFRFKTENAYFKVVIYEV